MSLPEVGKRAPSFSLPGIPEKTYRLADYRGSSVVLYFYPKDLTPGCTTEACDFRDNWKRLEQRGAVVLGISADPVSKHAKFRDKFELPFPLLEWRLDARVERPPRESDLKPNELAPLRLAVPPQEGA